LADFCRSALSIALTPRKTAEFDSDVWPMPANGTRRPVSVDRERLLRGGQIQLSCLSAVLLAFRLRAKRCKYPLQRDVSVFESGGDFLAP
jgi:hypothetical protein